MKNNTLELLKKIFIVIFVITLILILSILIYKTKDDKLITNVKKFVESDTKVLYISNKDNYQKYPIDLFQKYEVEYLYVDSTNLSRVEKNKLEKLINSKYLSNIIVIFENGKVKEAIIEYETEDKLNEFLSTNNILPEELGNVDNIIDSVESLLEDDLTIIYLPYKKSSNITWQDNIFKSISDDYNIKYERINAYLLSKFQKVKLNKILEISNVDDQIIILVKNKKIVGSIRGVNNKRTYLNELYKFNFIKEIEDYINYIDYTSFKNIINSREKNVVVIGKTECKYCSDIIDLFNKIIEENDIQINYIDIGTFDTETSSNIERDLKTMEYNDGFTTPLTMIVENGRLINYVIGMSSEEYFIDIFKENGIIK